MQDIRWKAFWLVFSLAFFCLILGVITNAIVALMIFILGILGYLVSHLYWLHQLLQWFRKPELSSMPVGTGIWEEVFAAIYHQQRRYGRSQAQLNSALERFRHAAGALPDGVVLLNSSDKIEWCNTTAEALLGLALPQDAGQPITYLVRHTDFLQYLHGLDFAQSIKLGSWRDTDITLEIQLVAFGSNQKLLICRDVSQLEKLENMRRDFIANVSHELRTPLTVVGGFLETIMDMDAQIPQGIRSYFMLMQEQTSRMRHLVEDLLTLSQLENSSALPQDADINVAAMLAMVMNEAHSLSNGRHQLYIEADPHLYLTGASEELHSAFGNLVSNAIRYTPEGGDITINWQQRGQEGVFSVRDTGIGIEQQHINRLTERFYRVDRSRSRETGGTGLGLSIVKHILTRHQAKLEIQSEPGEGSTFSAVFPKARLVHKHNGLLQ